MNSVDKKARKQAIMAQVHRVEDLLRRWDPIGIAPGTWGPADEYDGYALHIVSMVHQGTTHAQLTAHLTYLRTQVIGVEPLPAIDAETATAILHALKTTSGDAGE